MISKFNAILHRKHGIIICVFFLCVLFSITTHAGTTLWRTADWTQNFPYNELATSECGGHVVPTGCAASSMATKMRFHQWPPKGYLNAQGYWDDALDDEACNWFEWWRGDVGCACEGGSGACCRRESYISDHTYNWANMPLGRSTSSQPAIAQLIYDAGVSIKMNYGPDESSYWSYKHGGVMTDYMGTAMDLHFGYYGFVTKTDMSLSAMESDIRACIEAGLPVLIAVEGHSFIIDGYRTGYNERFHRNTINGNHGWVTLENAYSNKTIRTYHAFMQPRNYVYISNSGSNSGDGSLRYTLPIDRVDSWISSVPDIQGNDPRHRHHVWVKGGSYSAIDVSGYGYLYSYSGTATIGGRLKINTTANDNTVDEVPRIVFNGGKLIIN